MPEPSPCLKPPGHREVRLTSAQVTTRKVRACREPFQRRLTTSAVKGSCARNPVIKHSVTLSCPMAHLLHRRRATGPLLRFVVEISSFEPLWQARRRAAPHPDRNQGSVCEWTILAGTQQVPCYFKSKGREMLSADKPLCRKATNDPTTTQFGKELLADDCEKTMVLG